VDFLLLLAAGMERQTTSSIIMVRPAAFGFNVETAANNTFQHQPRAGEEEISRNALREFDDLVDKLRNEGVDVLVVEDTPEPAKPDAVFPNNWISFHSNGVVATYPMYSELRRQERRRELLDLLAEKYAISKIMALEDAEAQSLFLEGTGSMVLDRVNRVAYACLSPRTSESLLQKWCELFGYTPFAFQAFLHGQAIYHTNVMMAIGDGVGVVCLDVVEGSRREDLYQQLSSTGRDVVVLRTDQINTFAGNMLALRNGRGEQIMVMSAAAHASLDDDQIARIEKHAHIVSSDVHTIEQVGGGSVRCMIAENFLPHI
jgi:hypothetical protein